MANQSAGPPDATPIHLLFFGKNCPHSSKFIKKLMDYPELNVLFRKLSVEELPSLPPQLQTVPAIVINNKDLHQGPGAFKWLKENVAMYLSAGPELDPKGGYKMGPTCGDLGFSFIGSESNASEYNSGWSPLDAKNGSNIDKDKFDSEGKPKQKGDSSLPSMDSLIQQRNREIPMPQKPVESYER